MSPEPVRVVASIVDATHSHWRRLRRLMTVAVAALLTGFALLTFARSLSKQYVGLALFLSAFVAVVILGLIVIGSPQREGVVIDRLLMAIRELETPAVRDDRIATRLEEAASVLFVQFSAAPWRKRGPWRFRRQRMAVAHRAAAAVTSYVGLLDREDPDYQLIADDMRRAILRVAAGRWRQIADLDKAPGEPWAPTRMAELRQRFRSVFQHDAASKVAVALIGLAGALVALTAVVLRMAIGG